MDDTTTIKKPVKVKATGDPVRAAYRKWLRNTEAGREESEAMQDRLEDLKEKWFRKDNR